MFCPACGIENNQDNTRFCRSCGVDLRTVSRALNNSLPVRLAGRLDAYFENRFQRNLGNGVLNLIAFVFLLFAGWKQLTQGWQVWGVLMFVLGFVALVLG